MKHKHAGFTLVELMITLLISGLLIGGILSVFQQSKKSFTKQTTLSYIVEDGRYAIELLGKELRRVGYLINPNILLHTADDIFLTDDDAADSGLNLAIGERIIGSINTAGFSDYAHDINHLVFRYQLEPSGTCDNTVYSVKADCQNNGATWTPNGNDLDQGASPCSGEVSDEGVDGTASLKTIFLFVADSDGVPTLFCNAESNLINGAVVDSSANIPLLSYVEKIFVLYGEDTGADDGFANKYVTADQVGDWKNIVSIRIYLVLMSEEKNVATDTPGYQIDDVVYTVTQPDEKRLYRAFGTTLAFRN